MGRLDVSMKCVEVRRLFEEKQYSKALELADSVEVERVKSIVDLKILANVYEKTEKYEEAKEVLLLSYDKKPTKTVVYKLAYLSIRLNELEDAEEFYEEFAQMAPNSQDRYILKYGLERAHGTDYYVRIAILQALKQIEYMEEWAYELAKLYHKAGLAQDCIDECSEIMLWFGEGVIVEKAKLLRTYHLEGKESLEAYGILGTKGNEKYHTKVQGQPAGKMTGPQIQAVLQKELDRELEKTVDLQRLIYQDFQEKHHLEEEITRMWGENILKREELKKKQLRQSRQPKQEVAWQEETAWQEEVPGQEEASWQEEVPGQEETAWQEEDPRQEEMLWQEEAPWQEEVPSQEETAWQEEVPRQKEESRKKEENQSKTEDTLLEEHSAKNEEKIGYRQKPFRDYKEEENNPYIKYLESLDEIPDEIDYDELQFQLEEEAYYAEEEENTVQPLSKEDWLNKVKEVSQKKEQEEWKEAKKIVPKETSIVIDGEDVTKLFGNFKTEPKTRHQILTELTRMKKEGMPIQLSVTGRQVGRAIELANMMGKAMYKLKLFPSSSVARITAVKLNKIQLHEKQQQLKGNCVLIEYAGKMSADSAQSIMNMIDEIGQDIIVILVDTTDSLEELYAKYGVLRRYFTYHISV